MKRIIVLALSLVLLLTLCGCAPAEPEENAAVSPPSDWFSGSDEPYVLNPLTGRTTLPNRMSGRRPVAVMVNNAYVSWPQYGTSYADIIVEIETEGGITRLMCVYGDVTGAPKIGSVRSLRDQFMMCVMQLDPIIVHMGTSITADAFLSLNNIITMDEMFCLGLTYFDEERAQTMSTEHCSFTSGELVCTVGLSGYPMLDRPAKPAGNTAFYFVSEDETAKLAGTPASRVSYKFSKEGDYDGCFEYDANSEQYLKFQHGEPQTDALNSQQLAFDNLLLLFGDITYRQTLTTFNYAAGGSGWYFSKGVGIPIKWSKPDIDFGFQFTDGSGEAVALNTGKTHLAVISASLSQSLSMQ